MPHANDTVARRVLAVCESVDDEIEFRGFAVDDDNSNVVRIAAGAGSVSTLQRALTLLLPLARISVAASDLDGRLTAHVEVPRRDIEMHRARELVRSSAAMRSLRAFGFALVLCGVTLWVSAQI